jgi:hypothetical protein
MLDKVVVVSVEDGGYYSGGFTSGSTVNVTLQRGEDFASCDGILIWEEEFAEECFDEWVACAVAGEEGYTAMLVEDGVTTMYGAQ